MPRGLASTSIFDTNMPVYNGRLQTVADLPRLAPDGVSNVKGDPPKSGEFHLELGYNEAVTRYQSGVWRARVFHSLVLRDLVAFPEATVLDIGCGKGFDGDPKLAAILASHSSTYLGIEPDRSIPLPPICSHVYHSVFEQAAIEDESVDVAFCVMVLEHIKEPRPFVEKLHRILRPGGVFWGFTVDTRHWFPFVSTIADRLHLKERYLRFTRGERGTERYENYPVYYRMNNPEDILRLTEMFSSRSFINFYRTGQLDYYYGSVFRPVGRALERISHRFGVPGALLAIRLQK